MTWWIIHVLFCFFHRRKSFILYKLSIPVYKNCKWPPSIMFKQFDVFIRSEGSLCTNALECVCRMNKWHWVCTLCCACIQNYTENDACEWDWTCIFEREWVGKMSIFINIVLAETRSQCICFLHAFRDWCDRAKFQVPCDPLRYKQAWKNTELDFWAFFCLPFVCVPLPVCFCCCFEMILISNSLVSFLCTAV